MFVLEAIKMENPTPAPLSGVGGDITAPMGDSISDGFLLTTIEMERGA